MSQVVSSRAAPVPAAAGLTRECDRLRLSVPQYKLCRVKELRVGPKGIPNLLTHDGRTIRYPDPQIKVSDTIQLDLATAKIKDYLKFDTGEWAGRR